MRLDTLAWGKSLYHALLRDADGERLLYIEKMPVLVIHDDDDDDDDDCGDDKDDDAGSSAEFGCPVVISGLVFQKVEF